MVKNCLKKPGKISSVVTYITCIRVTRDWEMGTGLTLTQQVNGVKGYSMMCKRSW